MKIGLLSLAVFMTLTVVNAATIHAEWLTTSHNFLSYLNVFMSMAGVSLSLYLIKISDKRPS